MVLETAPLSLWLASSSPYRRELLQRLVQDFTCQSAAVDESPKAGESAHELVLRLSEAKARAVAAKHLDKGQPVLVIGSDQVAVMDQEIIGKPGNYENAFNQLKKLSGNEISFLTGLCVLDNRSSAADVCCIPCQVRFRELDDKQIRWYLKQEPALDCAGAFKSEGLGIALLERFVTSDPT
jgi:MAF protein